MKYFLIYISLIFCGFSTYAQINELGIFVGGTNYIGDVGPTTYIAPNEPAFGIIYKWNRDSLFKLKTQYLAHRVENLEYRQIQLKDVNTAQSQNEKELISFEFRDYSSVNQLVSGIVEDYHWKNVHFYSLKVDQEINLDFYWFQI
mgnify:CR=1 FL=1